MTTINSGDPGRVEDASRSGDLRDDDVVGVGLVRLDQIIFHPRNVRRDLGDLRALAHSIAQFGVIEPVVLELYGPRIYRLREGHRRVAAARLAGQARIPAVIHGHALADADWILHSLHTFETRRGLDDAERAEALRELHTLGMSWPQIAASLAVPVSTIRHQAREQPAAATADPVERARRPSFGRRAATEFITTWRWHLAEHPMTAEQILDALEHAVATGRPEPTASPHVDHSPSSPVSAAAAPGTGPAAVRTTHAAA